MATNQKQVKNLKIKYSSELVQIAIYAFFACMAIYHLSANSESVLCSVLYFSITNISVLVITMLLAFRSENISKNAKDTIIYYLIYLFSFSLFIVCVGFISKDINDFYNILGNCIGGVFYMSILGIIAILKIITHGFRKPR